MIGESSLENLPEIVEPEGADFDEVQEDEPEPTIEEKLAELVQNLLHKTSSVVTSAMKELERMCAQGENVPELVECANQLVETIKEETNNNQRFDYVPPVAHNHLVSFLLLRFEEERVNMKKTAICTLQALFPHLKNDAGYDAHIEKVCADRLAHKCRDPALAIRKQAALTLTRLVQQCGGECEQLRLVWLQAVMHQIVDREPSVQQQASKLIAEMLIEPILHGTDDNNLVWILLAAVEEEADLRRLLLRTLVHLNNEKLLSERFVTALQNRALKRPRHANPCWMVLSELSAFLAVSPDSAIEHWVRLNLEEPNRLIGYMAKLIANRAKKLSIQQRNFLKEKLGEALKTHKLNPSFIGAVYFAFARVSEGVGSGDVENRPPTGYAELERFNQRWYGSSLKALDKTVYEEGCSAEHISSVEEQLENQITSIRLKQLESNEGFVSEETGGGGQDGPRSSVVLECAPRSASFCSPPSKTVNGNNNNQNSQNSNITEDTTNKLNENYLIRLLTSIGECIQYTPALISKRLFRLLQVIIASDVLKKVHHDHLIEQGTTVAPTPLNLIMSPNTSFNTELPGLPGGTSVAPSIITSVAPSQIGGSPTQTLRTALPNPYQIRIKKRVFRGELMTRRVRATAVLTLGKLCLQDEQLAKRCIPTFIRELKQNSDHFVRNNIVVVVCDLCIRYTSLVDRYSTILASSLRDPSVLIRRQTLMLLTNLIKEQYLKWEGPIIIRFLTTLLDADPCVKEYADFCLKDILLPQFRERMFFHHFLESAFCFNDVRHPSRIQQNLDDFELNAEVDKQCSLEGRQKIEDRLKLYKYMLKTLEDQQKVSILEKIGLEVFVPIVEGGMRLADVRVRSILFDAFKIMQSEEIKLKMQLGKRDVDYEGDEEEPPELIKTAARNFISTTFRKTIAETVMPHLFSINAFLKEKRSPLAEHCYSVILEICRDHEEQLDDFLSSDPQLKAEIRFDLRKNNGPQRVAGDRGTPAPCDTSQQRCQQRTPRTLEREI